MNYRVKNLRWCPRAEKAGWARAVGLREFGRAIAIVHTSGSQAVIRTPSQARKIAQWLNKWADALEKEVQRGE